MGLLGSIGSFLGDVGSSVAGPVLSYISKRSENSKNRRAQINAMYLQDSLNRDYARWSAMDLPSLNRSGMEKAGFNPILAITNGTGTSGNVSAVYSDQPAAQFDFSGVGSAINNARQYRLAKERAESALASEEKSRQLADAKIEETKARTRSILHGIEHPSGVWSGMSQNLQRAADFLFGPSTPERKSLFKDLKNVFGNTRAGRYMQQINNYYKESSAKSLDGRTRD